MNRTEEKLPAKLVEGLFAGAIVLVLVFLAISGLLWQIDYPLQFEKYFPNLRYWLALQLAPVLPLPFIVEMANSYRAYLDQLGSHFNPLWLTGRFYLAAVAGVGSAIWVAYHISRPAPATRVIKGRRVYEGEAAKRRLKRLSGMECKKSAEGLALHPDFEWKLSTDRETRHMLIVGSVGGGKTAIINPLTKAGLKRGDRMVIYDNKGDYTSWVQNIALFAPWDTRSMAWDIGRDCADQQDAKEVAARLIPEGNDPLWHTAARQILTAVLIKLQVEQRTAWGWKQLYKMVCLPKDELMDIVRTYTPEAIHVADAPEKTALSVLANFGAHMSLIGDLARAWGDLPNERRFSVIHWLDNDQSKHRVLVLQGSGKYTELAQAFIRSIVTLMVGHINSPGFSESGERRLWFVLDEFPQLGRLEQMAQLLEIGRSKGVRVVLGAQDIEQIKAIYGNHMANSWSSMIGTHIIVRINPGETANYISKQVIGYQTIDRITLREGKLQPPVRADILVVEPSELESGLGRSKDGVKALLLGYGDVFVLNWSFTKIEKIREPSVPAQWMKTVTMIPTQPKRPNPDSCVTTSPPRNPRVDSAVDPVPKSDNPSADIKSTAQRLVLKQHQKYRVMAVSGTAVGEAAESLKDMTNTSAGGNHESC